MKVSWRKPVVDMAINEYCRPRFWEHKLIHPCWKFGIPNSLRLATIWLSATGRISWVKEMSKYNWVKLKGEEFLNNNLGKLYSHWEINHNKILLHDLQYDILRKYSNTNIGKFKETDLNRFVSLIKAKDKGKSDKYIILDGNHTAYYWMKGLQKIDYIYVGVPEK